MALADLLNEMVAQGASDLHVKAGSPPGLRIHGKLVPIPGLDPLTADDTKALVDEMLDEERGEKYKNVVSSTFQPAWQGARVSV